MANYAFFRPTSFTQYKNFDEFVNSRNAYDIDNDTYCKTDTDGSRNNIAHGTGLTFVPYSKTGPYTRHLSDYFSQYNISESLPQGAIITGIGCGMIFASQVSVFGNTPLLRIGITNGRSENIMYNCSMDIEPSKGNTNTKAAMAGFTTIGDYNQVIDCTLDWLKNNVCLLYSVTGRHKLDTSSTVIQLMEIFGFARWKLPFRMTIVNGYGYQSGSSGQVSNIKNVYEYNGTVGYNAYPNSGYSPENPIITFSQGNPSYTWTPSNKSFIISSLKEGVNVKIQFRKEHTITVNAGTGGTASSSAQKVPDGSQVTLTATPNTGYRFVKWNDGDTNATRTITPTSDMSYTAEFALINYTINFIGNNNTGGSVPSITATYNSSYNLTNSFTRINYIFNSWNTKADGSGVKYNNKQSVSNLTAKHNDSITLYAQWDFVGDINYDNLFSLSSWYTSIAGQKTGQGGAVTADLKTGTLSISCPDNASSPDNSICAWDYDIPLQAGESYIFEYDTTIPSGGGTQVHIFYINDFNATTWMGFPNINIYRNASESKVQMPFTLPAEAVGVNFRFGTTNEKGITNTLSNMKLYKQSTYNSSISKINNYKSRDYIPDLASVYSPSKTGYDFNGWARNEGDADSLTLQGIKTFTQSTTVYSKWTPYNYYIEFNGNGADNTGTMSTQTFTYDQSKNLTQNGFSRYRYEFVNWNTKADGTGQSYENNSEILNLTAEKNKTIVLYAQWKYAPLGQSIFVKNIPVKKILIDSDEVIEVFTNKAVFFRPLKEE